MATPAYNNDDFSNEFEGDGSSFADNIDLQHYLRILRKHKWLITFFTAAVTALAAYYAYTATPIYQSTATLLIEQQKTNVPNIEEFYGLDTQDTDYYQTQFELLKSRSLAEKVIGHLNLWNDPELSPAAREAEARALAAQRSALGVSATASGAGFGATIKEQVDSFLVAIGLKAGTEAPAGIESDAVSTVIEPLEIELAGEQAVSSTVSSGSSLIVESTSESARSTVISNFMQRVTIAPVRKTKLVKISYESKNPELAATVANAIGEQYIQSYLENKLDRSAKASTVLNERLASLKTILDTSEQKLIDYKEANGLVDVGGSVNRLREQELLLLTTELAQARSDLAESNDIYNEVRSLRSRPELLESVPGVQADPLVQRTKIEEGQAQRALDELLNRYGEKHPRVVDAKSQLSTLKTTLNGHVQRVVGSIEKDYQLKRQKVASIQRELAAGRQAISNTGSKQFELEALEREVVTNQEIYDKFFNTISEAKSADGLETANALVSDFAVASNNPVKPKKQLIIALAALASLVLSMLMALLYEQMDDTIKGTNDIENKLGLKLLGILPLVKTGLFGQNQALPLNPAEITDKKGTFAEAVNTARTALSMDDSAGERKVIVVTSSVPGEGKSTASINLAYSFAQLERVLLIDCDLRRPTVAKAAGLDKNVPGLSSLIVNAASARECIVRGAFGGCVDIIPSGPIPDQPLELLSSNRFKKILDQLCEHYDRIIIDSAPTQAVSDALVLSQHADAVVYAVKSNETSIELVKRGVQRLRQVKAPVAGVLITQVDINRIASYGGDYYYQGYYDYYGYTEKGSAKQPGKIRLTQEELINIKNDNSEYELDFGFEPHARRRGGRGEHTTQTNGSDAARFNDDINEFDMTTQIEMPQNTGNGTRRSGRNRFSDDLDII